MFPLPSRFRLTNTLSPADVGVRVVVRRTLDQGGFADVLGGLESWADGVLTIRRRDGSVVAVDEATIVAGKRIPPTPTRAVADCRRIPVDALAEVAARGWPPQEVAYVGSWRLGAAAGWTLRANSVVPLGEPGMASDAALTRVRDWYADRGLPALFQVQVASALDQELEARGWRDLLGGPGVFVQVAPVAAVLGRLEGAMPEVTTSLHAEPPAGWLAIYRGGSLPPVALKVLGSPAGAVTFVTAELDGRVVAGGRAVVLDGWVGVAGMEVDPAYRRRGLARAVLAALLRAGADGGASSAYLQVEGFNEKAVGLYTGLGFATRYVYRYRQEP